MDPEHAPSLPPSGCRMWFTYSCAFFLASWTVCSLLLCNIFIYCGLFSSVTQQSLKLSFKDFFFHLYTWDLSNVYCSLVSIQIPAAFTGFDGSIWSQEECLAKTGWHGVSMQRSGGLCTVWITLHCRLDRGHCKNVVVKLVHGVFIHDTSHHFTCLSL